MNAVVKESLETIVVETAPDPSFSIVWMHGLGADGHDFEPLVPELATSDLPALRFVRDALPSRFIGRALPADAGELPSAGPESRAPFDLLRAANGLAVSLTVCAASALLTSLLGIDWMFMVLVTALSLVVANFARPVVRRVGSEFEIGALFMYVFFVTIGAGSVIMDPYPFDGSPVHFSARARIVAAPEEKSEAACVDAYNKAARELLTFQVSA